MFNERDFHQTHQSRRSMHEYVYKYVGVFFYFASTFTRSRALVKIVSEWGYEFEINRYMNANNKVCFYMRSNASDKYFNSAWDSCNEASIAKCLFEYFLHTAANIVKFTCTRTYLFLSSRFTLVL